jgi:hypothetical protein
MDRSGRDRGERERERREKERLGEREEKRRGEEKRMLDFFVGTLAKPEVMLRPFRRCITEVVA